MGDVDPEQVQLLALKYFGPWQASPQQVTVPATGFAPGTEQLPKPASLLNGGGGEFREVSKVGPAVLLGYYRPPLATREGIQLEALSDVLSSGRTSRLVSELVMKQKALSASVTPAYPGTETTLLCHCAAAHCVIDCNDRNVATKSLHTSMGF